MAELLNETQQDVLTELFNIGVGCAAAALSEMLGEEVSLNVPLVRCSQFEDAAETLARYTTTRVDAVEQAFNGRFSGISFLVFGEASSLELVQRLLGSDIPLDELTEMEQDALKEVANIILNACFGTISDVLDCPLESGIPKMVSGSCEQVLNLSRLKPEEDPIALIMLVTFALPKGEITGSITYVMTTDSARHLATELDNYYARMI